MDPIDIDGMGGDEDERRREEAARLLQESGLTQALGGVRMDPRAQAQGAMSGVREQLGGIRVPQIAGAPPRQSDVVPPRPGSGGGGLAGLLGDPRRASQPLPAPSAPDKRAQAAQVWSAAGLDDPSGSDPEREAQLAALRAMAFKGPTR